MKLALIKDWHDDPEHLAGNKDGILAAWDLLAARHSVRFFSRHTHLSIRGLLDSFDAILCWGSLDRPWHADLPPHVPALLCFAGGPTEHPFLKNFRHIFVESQVYLDRFQSQGIPASRAFGTNTTIFRPERRTPKLIDALYPASFCSHKNHEVFARAVGSRGLAVGFPNDLAIVSKCLQLGTPTLTRVSSLALADLYNLSRTTVIPCGPAGGSQRVVLESLACGTPVILADDNDKCREFIEESGFGLLVPPVPEAIREAVDNLTSEPLDAALGPAYIAGKWTQWHYAQALEEGILTCLKK